MKTNTVKKNTRKKKQSFWSYEVMEDSEVEEEMVSDVRRTRRTVVSNL